MSKSHLTLWSWLPHPQQELLRSTPRSCGHELHSQDLNVGLWPKYQDHCQRHLPVEPASLLSLLPMAHSCDSSSRAHPGPWACLPPTGRAAGPATGHLWETQTLSQGGSGVEVQTQQLCWISMEGCLEEAAFKSEASVYGIGTGFGENLRHRRSRARLQGLE